MNTISKPITIFQPRVKLQDKITFIQNLSVMIKSGIPIIEALDVSGEDVESTALKRIIANLSRSLEKGQPIFKALKKETGFLNQAHMGILEAGEVSGQLHECLERIKLDLQRESDLISRIKGALSYPAIIFLALLGIGGGIITVVLPKIADIFARMGIKKLPLPTRILIWVGNFVNHNLIWLLVGTAVGIAGLVAFSRSETGGKVMHAIVAHIPVVNSLVKDISFTRFSRTLGILVDSGVNIDQGLEIASRVFPRPVRKIVTGEIVKKVQKGESLADSFKHYRKYFPGMMVRMMAVGEQSGNLSELLGELSNYYERRVDSRLTILTNMMEPILMLVVGVAIGGAVLSIMAPIYSMVGSLQQSL